MILKTRNNMPKGVSYKGVLRDSFFTFIYDLTYKKDGKMVYERIIFNEILRLISEAKELILIDFFLFNSYNNDGTYPNYTEELTNALIVKKKENKDIRVIIITDEINTFYGYYKTKHLESLKENDIEVIVTDLDMVADSNQFYSFFWRLLGINRLGVKGKGWVTNILTSKSEKVTIRSYLRMFNFKANHRKVVITEKEGLVTSFNPHDTSGNHSNIGFLVQGEIIKDLLESENAIIEYMNGKRVNLHNIISLENQAKAMVITEGKIMAELLEEIRATGSGDKISMVMFYLAENSVIKELIAASNRGVEIKLILDYNRDAFGLKKVGIPNRPVAKKLKESSDIQIKWYNTHGEQFHSKMTIFQRKDEVILIGGSCNLTRRNLKDYNLETNLKVILSKEDLESQKVLNYFQRIWNNEDAEYTLDFKMEDLGLRTIGYYIQEWTGLSSF